MEEKWLYKPRASSPSLKQLSQASNTSTTPLSKRNSPRRPLRLKMKLSLIPLAVLATAAVGARVTQSEADDWYDCTRKALKMVDNGKDDSGTTCTLFECLWNNAEEYHRGGMFGNLAGVLNTACAARGVPIIGSFLK